MDMCEIKQILRQALQRRDQEVQIKYTNRRSFLSENSIGSLFGHSIESSSDSESDLDLENKAKI